MTIRVNPPPLQVPPELLESKLSAAFFNSLLNTLYQLWNAVYGLELSTKVSTTDNTVTALVRTQVDEGKTVMINAFIVARRTGGAAGSDGDSAWYMLTGAYKNVAGVLTGIGTPSRIQGEDQTAWDVGFSSSGTEAVVTVTGAASNDITWEGTISVYEAGS